MVLTISWIPIQVAHKWKPFKEYWDASIIGVLSAGEGMDPQNSIENAICFLIFANAVSGEFQGQEGAEKTMG